MGLGPQWTLRAAPEAVLKLEPAQVLASGAAGIQITTQLAGPVPALPVDAQAIAAMDWSALAFAAASCTRCDLCHSRSSVVFGRGARDAALIVLGSAPSSADEEAGAPLCGAPGQLLDNMLQAIKLAPPDVYVTNLVKCRVRESAGAPPTPEQLVACRPYLEREFTLLTQARTVLALGQPAARSLLGAAVLSATLRGAPHRCGALAVVATLHPEDVLQGHAQNVTEGMTESMAEGKAKVWADLCVARSAHAASL
jgi:DNA polymerase